MSKKKKEFYAWKAPGCEGGVYTNWEECKKAFSGIAGEKHQGFNTEEEAYAFIGKKQPKPITSAIKELSQPKDLSRPINVYSEDISPEVEDFCNKYGFSHLNKEQKLAVQSTKEANVLFAVPGSGKTSVIIARVGYLIYSCHVDVNDIITLTFTKSAALEMKDRFQTHFEKYGSVAIPNFRTIHSFCYMEILPKLRVAGYPIPPNVINKPGIEEVSSTSILYTILKKQIKGKFSIGSYQDSILAKISFIKNNRLDSKDYEKETISIGTHLVKMAKLYNDYQEHLQKIGCIDFDDMLGYSLNGLKQYPSVLESIQRKYRYWNVDEAQDNSAIQHDLLKLLVGSNGNIFMVGDDDQSIYYFRGAKPTILLDYIHEDSVNTIVMSTNYRSGKKITDVANLFIEKNKIRQNKRIQPNIQAIDGKVIVPASFTNEVGQYDYIIRLIKKAQEEHKTLGVLFQYNISSLPLIIRLFREKIDFEKSKPFKKILSGKFIGNIWNVLRFVDKQNDMELWNRFTKAIDLYPTEDEKEEIKKLHKLNPKESILMLALKIYSKDEQKKKELNDCLRIFHNISTISPSEFVSFFLRDNALNISEKMIIYSILSMADQFSSIADMTNTLKEILEHDEETEDEETLEEIDYHRSKQIRKAISLSTIHSAKGREWDVVIIIDCLQDGIPGSWNDKSLFAVDKEEMRRLFYVAITRAKEELHLLTLQAYHGNRELASSFIKEIAYYGDSADNFQTSFDERHEEKEAQENKSFAYTNNNFYAVAAGRKIGIYTYYEQARQQIDGFSNAKWKCFGTEREAKQYLIENSTEWICKEDVKYQNIKKVMCCNVPQVNQCVDLPQCIQKAYNEHFKEKLKSIQPIRYTDGTPFAYCDKAFDYTLIYFPVNFYKVWYPLFCLLEKFELAINLKILELGAGPGTSTFSTLCFYRELATENPEINFSIDYTVIEKEKAFEPIFNIFKRKFIESCPQNLILKNINFVVGDAFEKYLNYKENSFDLIIESNLLNNQELLPTDHITRFDDCWNKLLKGNGKAILIEPGKNENVFFLNTLTEPKNMWANPDKYNTYIAGIQWVKDLQDKKLRYAKENHWFACAIFKKGGN